MSEKKLEVVKQGNQKGLVETMATKYNLDPKTFLDTIKATVLKPGKNGKQATNEELAAFLMVANKYQLDPFTNEIYAFPSKKGGIVPVVGIDGHANIMNRHPQYDGLEIEFCEEKISNPGAKDCPEWCEVKIFRKDRTHPITTREYLDEVYCGPKNGYPGPWQSHTKRMLRHKSIIQGARLAFGITGIYDQDEAERILEAETVQRIVEPQKTLANPFDPEKDIPAEEVKDEIFSKPPSEVMENEKGEPIE